MPLRILVDADACPVKDEVYRVAARHGASVVVVAANALRVPAEHWITRIAAGPAFDAADDWIAGEARAGDVVVTGDIPLADRALKAGARVLRHDGQPFTDASIGTALATRAIMEDLRAGIGITGGPKPFTPRDRSAFLQALDLALVRLRREGHG